MSVISEEKLIAKLENKAYREAYVCEHIKTSVPLQIRHLREQRELTQAELAKQAKTTQTVISRLEDPNYGNLTLNSLLKIATGLDVALLVKFVPFTKLLSEFQDLSLEALSVKSFTEELVMLKSWASRAKNTRSQVSRYIGGFNLGTVHTVPPIDSLKVSVPSFDDEIAEGAESTEEIAATIPTSSVDQAGLQRWLQIQLQVIEEKLNQPSPAHTITTTPTITTTNAIGNRPFVEAPPSRTLGVASDLARSMQPSSGVPKEGMSPSKIGVVDMPRQLAA